MAPTLNPVLLLLACVFIIVVHPGGADSSANSTTPKEDITQKITSTNIAVVDTSDPVLSTPVPATFITTEKPEQVSIPTVAYIPPTPPTTVSNQDTLRQLLQQTGSSRRAEEKSSLSYDNLVPSVVYENEPNVALLQRILASNQKSVRDGQLNSFVHYDEDNVNVAQDGKSDVMVMKHDGTGSWKPVSNPVLISAKRVQKKKKRKKSKSKLVKPVMVIAEAVPETDDDDQEDDGDFSEGSNVKRPVKVTKPSNPLYQYYSGPPPPDFDIRGNGQHGYQIPTPPPMPGMPLVANVYWRKIVFPKVPVTVPLDQLKKADTLQSDEPSFESERYENTKPTKKVEKYIVYYVKKNGKGGPQEARLVGTNQEHLKKLIRQLHQMEFKPKSSTKGELLEIGDSYPKRKMYQSPYVRVYRKSSPRKSSKFVKRSSGMAITKRKAKLLDSEDGDDFFEPQHKRKISKELKDSHYEESSKFVKYSSSQGDLDD